MAASSGAESLPSFALRPSQWQVEVSTHIGGRPRQEDRFDTKTSIPVGESDTEAAFFGVWDGTVCPHASNYVHTRCRDHHLQTPGFSTYTQMVGGGEAQLQELARPLAAAVSEGYAATDGDLLESCRQISNHYSSSTSVTCLVASGILSVGHLGDSRCYLIVKGQGGGGAGLRGVRLTEDHKPDDAEERRRIETSGGSIQILHHHNNKPFIRGGDFDRRKATGERVMQLQYSRAFGGKDLKPFGLSASPSVRQVAIAQDHIGFVLCSDGVCDVAEADDVAAVVGSAWARGEDASAVLVNWAMQERQRVGIGADNVTAVVVKFEPVARQSGAKSSGSGKGRF
mmetsp:Transcript_65156/g.122038  ORF Transcript_65156/g.122038 Transcript_65156/m.122038 type:complete len:341 (-) Transcript_65156:499-1521(-)